MSLRVSNLRVRVTISELIGLDCGDVDVGQGAHVACWGKGRKARATPLRADTVKVLRDWLDERAAAKDQPLFVSNRGTRLSRDAIERIVRKYVALASDRCQTLKGKRVSPHCLRHTAAMELLHRGVGTAIIALWLGHESVETTRIYLHADLTIKEKAMARTEPVGTSCGRYRPSDALLRFLKELRICRYRSRGSPVNQPVGLPTRHIHDVGIFAEFLPPSCGRNAHCCTPPAQFRTWSLNHPAPSSGD